MKKIIVQALSGLILLSLSSHSALACATCGCMNPYLGIYPYDRTHQIGLWYRYNSEYAPGVERYRYYTAELRGNFYLGKRFSLYAVLPYTWGTHTLDATDSSQATKNHIKGINDVTVILNYFPVWHESPTLAYRLGIRGGGRIPLSKRYPGLDPDPEFALGTGRPGYVVGLIGMLRYQRFGISSVLNYTGNVKNKYDYRVGSTLALAADVFYRQYVKLGNNRLTIMPSAGLFVENIHKDKYLGQEVDDSGGKLFFTTASINVFYQRVGVSFIAQFPSSVNFNDAGKQLDTRLLAGFTFALGGQKTDEKS